MSPALLALADGSLFRGLSVGADGESVGEVVFNTSMTGYQEILTDPSYARQMITLTHPHIGNTGCNAADEEAAEVFAAGLIVRDVPRHPSNWRSEVDLSSWLRRRGVVAIADIDTRRLTRILRENGAQSGCLMAGGNIDPERALDMARKFGSLKGADLAREVSCANAYDWNEGSHRLDQGDFPSVDGQYKVVAYDFGVKRNILRLLADRGCRLRVVPATTPAAEVLAMNPDGVFLSNGPGDPEPCDYAISAIREFLDAGIPTFGICLGHQLMGLAAGGRTRKMKFGHHGGNHPVHDLDSGRVLITAQNHGFEVDAESLPDNIRITHRSLFDGSLQGIAFTDRPAFGFQGHPEASPGPHDIDGLFDQFLRLIREYRQGANA